MIDIRDFGGMGDGVTDTVGPFADAVAAASDKGQSVRFPVGTFRFASQPAALGTGVCLVGDGNSGASWIGTVLIRDYSEADPEAGFLTADGHGTAYAGSGGLFRDLTLHAGPGTAGGTAVKLLSLDDDHRCGWWTLERVVVTTRGGTWAHALIADGMSCDTSGGQGLRELYVDKCTFCSCTAARETVVLRNCVETHWKDDLIMPAGSGNPLVPAGLVVTGGSVDLQKTTYAFFTDVHVIGSVVFDLVKDFSFQGGRIGEGLTVTAGARNGRVNTLLYGPVQNAGTLVTVAA